MRIVVLRAGVIFRRSFALNAVSRAPKLFLVPVALPAAIPRRPPIPETPMI